MLSELIGKFKIAESWDQQLDDPESDEFILLSDTIKKGLMTMLSQDKNLSERADINVGILAFRFVKPRFYVKSLVFPCCKFFQRLQAGQHCM